MVEYKFIKLVKLPSTDKKKYKAIFKNIKSNKEKNIKFGSNIPYLEDYTIHKDKKRLNNFLSRFNKTIEKQKNNPLSPMFWSLWLLWNKPSFEASLKDIKEKLKKLGYM